MKTEKDLAGTPLLKQYFALKAKNPDCLLLFRVGDFYEAYGEDARTAARELSILLTAKDAGDGQRIPMAGVPHHSVAPYLRTLVKKGFKVGIAEQMEDPREAKGLVKREVVEVITRGTILDDELLEERKNNFIAALLIKGENGGLAIADLSTGEFYLTGFKAQNPQKFLEEMLRWAPVELLLAGESDCLPQLKAELLKEKFPLNIVEETPELAQSEELLKETFKLPSLLGSGVEDYPAAVRVSGLLINYLRELRKTEKLSFARLCVYQVGEHLIIDPVTARHLELTRTLLSEQKEGSLLWALDETRTPMGGRLLRQWLERPLKQIPEIQKRHQAVEELDKDYRLLSELREKLKEIKDLERILSRIVYGSGSARDLKNFANSLLPLPELQAFLWQGDAELLKELAKDFDPLPEIKELLFMAIVDNPPVAIKEGGMIKPGFNAELDELRELRNSAKQSIARIETKERERTGIKSLKIGYNQVFGYYVEVTRSNLALVPSDYIRKQTLSNAERFICPELKEYEARVLGAEEQIRQLEYQLFLKLRQEVSNQEERVRKTSQVIAQLDLLAGFAYLAGRYRYVKPELCAENIISIKEGRHPVVERKVSTGFVANEVELEEETSRFLIVTGPNMSGKSTYLRQVALIVIMAQMGSFVPAKAARLGMVDRIFTRVGATDDLHLGQSTFMVEMSETANILNYATPRSLVILDEVGRGTSTFDGMAIAWAVAEYIYEKVKAKTLFATHFHELTELQKRYAGIKNLRVLVREEKGDVIFLHKIVPGGADRSYGIYVAKLAGIPAEVLQRAEEIQEKLREEKKLNKKVSAPDTIQMSLLKETSHPLLEELKKVNILELTPLSALNLIHDWQKRLHKGP